MPVGASRFQYVRVCVSACQYMSVHVSTCKYVSVSVSTCLNGAGGSYIHYIQTSLTLTSLTTDLSKITGWAQFPKILFGHVYNHYLIEISNKKVILIFTSKDQC